MQLTTLCKATELKDFRFKQDERTLFRELNKSPFILHSVKETLTQTWHKVFLIVQVHLGCVEFPSEKGFGHLKCRVLSEKGAIFDRLNRLVRCFIDCRAFDGNGLCTKAGLELARALAAGSWENKPSQLSQIPGSGPVTVRKWVSHGVHTVLGLADRGFEEIERISSRNPPYGMNMLKTLEKFPRLAMRTDLIIETAHRPQNEGNVTVVLKVNLAYTNSKGVPTWYNKVPAVTFMVLTTDGNLAYFWRGNLKKIDRSTGLDLKFPVVLSGPGQKVNCYFSCEEIVGTQVTEVLEPDVPKEAFKKTLAQPLSRKPSTINLYDDDMDDGDVLDEDMLDAALESENRIDEKGSSDYLGPLDDAEEDFPLIDNLLSPETVPAVPAAPASPATPADSASHNPAKMDNGKWMCNHQCRNGGLTASGHPCMHKCCREGLDKPRRPPAEKKKNKQTTGDAERVGEGSFAVGASTKHAAKGKSHDASTGQKFDAHGPTANSANMKRKRLSDDNYLKTSTSKKRIIVEEASDLESLPDIECFDLSTVPGSSEANDSSLAKSDHYKTDQATNPSEAFSDEGLKAFDEALGRGNTYSPYDDYDFEDDEFPDPETILQFDGAKDTGISQTMSEKDETLCPGVVETLKESMDFG